MAVVKKSRATKRPVAAPPPASLNATIVKAALRRAASKAKPRWDVFISHSSLDKGMATRLGQDLVELGVRVWMDYENLFAGDLLAEEIGEAIRDSQAFALLWSASTDGSRWVPLELQAALATRHPVLLCLLDPTPYAHHRQLADRFYCDFRSSYEAGLAAFRGGLAQQRGGDASVHLRAGDKAPQEIVREIDAVQREILDALDRRDITRAGRRQSALDPVVEDALARWPLDPMVSCLAGYERKNAALIARDKAGGKLSPKVLAALEESARFFLRALASDPRSCSALNGLGSVETTRGNLQMAEHYVLRALHEARQQGADYEAARDDLAAIRAAEIRRSGRSESPPVELVEPPLALGAESPTAHVRYRGAATAVASEQREELRSSVRVFAAYLASIGLPGAAGRPLDIEISADAPYEAAYVPDRCAIVMKPIWARDASVVFREYAHHALLHAALAKRSGSAGSCDGDTLESGVADYLACSFADTPRLGAVGARIAFDAPCLRDLDNHESMNDHDARSAPQHRGAVWAGVFWQVRKRVGARLTDALVAGAWAAACKAEGRLVSAFLDDLRARERGMGQTIESEIAARKITAGCGLETETAASPEGTGRAGAGRRGLAG